MIEEVSKRFDAGEITPDHVEQLLKLVYPTDEQARDERRERVMPGGVIVKYQLVALNKQAWTAIRHNPPPPPAEKIPEQFLHDVPEPLEDEHRGPDFVPEIKNKLGIIAAVRMFGKPQERIRDNRIEGIMIRCPFSYHTDHRPSAWANTEKNTWFCAVCHVGGDAIDFYAAARHDMQPSDFHHSPEFRKIIEEMADALGIDRHSPIDTSAWASPLPDPPDQTEIEVPVALEDDYVPVEGENDRDNDPPIPPKVPPSQEADEPVTISEDDVLRGIAIPLEDQDIGDQGLYDIETPVYDVERLMLDEDTFLYKWLDQAKIELPWIPPEYFMMLGFQALGLAAGHCIISRVYGMPLTGSLMMTLIGPSGFGKTTAANRLKRMLATVHGPKWNSSTGWGVKMAPSPGSAEALVVMMRTDVEDPAGILSSIEQPTTAWLFEDEFATFIERTRRRGGGHLKQRLMQFHDFVKESSTPEAVVADFSLSGRMREVHDSFMSALFLTQTQSIRTLAERVDLVSGFLNRIVPVFGLPIERRSFDALVNVDPNPPYFEEYEKVWAKCREDSNPGHPIVLEFTDTALKMASQHPFFDKAEKLGEQASIFARLSHIALRLAFLLALNDRTAEAARKSKTLRGSVIDAKHLKVAIDVVDSFVVTGFQALTVAVSTDEIDELGDEIVKYLEKYYTKYSKWPAAHLVKKQAFWKRYSPHVGPRAMDHLRFSTRISEVVLVDGNKREDIILSTSGQWARFSSLSGKSYSKENFYASIIK